MHSASQSSETQLNSDMFWIVETQSHTLSETSDHRFLIQVHNYWWQARNQKTWIQTCGTKANDLQCYDMQCFRIRHQGENVLWTCEGWLWHVIGARQLVFAYLWLKVKCVPSSQSAWWSVAWGACSSIGCRWGHWVWQDVRLVEHFCRRPGCCRKCHTHCSGTLLSTLASPGWLHVWTATCLCVALSTSACRLLYHPGQWRTHSLCGSSCACGCGRQLGRCIHCGLQPHDLPSHAKATWDWLPVVVIDYRHIQTWKTPRELTFVKLIWHCCSPTLFAGFWHCSMPRTSVKLASPKGQQGLHGSAQWRRMLPPHCGFSGNRQAFKPNLQICKGAWFCWLAHHYWKATCCPVWLSRLGAMMSHKHLGRLWGLPELHLRKEMSAARVTFWEQGVNGSGFREDGLDTKGQPKGTRGN